MMNKMFKDFWINSGCHLLKDRGSIGLIPNEDYMKAYFLRPELELVKESCQAEKELRSKLIENPFYIVKDDELLSMKDKDAIENYKAVLSFRNFLSQSINLEEAYLKIANGEKFFFPPMFLDQIVQIILKEILKSEEDPMILRVAEIFFRTQNVTLDDGKIMIADSSTVQTLYDQQNINRSDNMVKEVQLDILTSETKEIYWMVKSLHKARKLGKPYMPPFQRTSEITASKEVGGFHQKIVALTSPKCVSACDIMASLLSHSKRATLIGLPTNGTGAGARTLHPFNGTVWKDDHKILAIKIPNFFINLLK